jgi:hypothetical protein
MVLLSTMTKRKIRTARSRAVVEAVANGAECKTLSVPEAGRRYYNLGRNGSYEAVKRGEIPVTYVLGKMRVPIILMDRRLEEAGATKAVSGAELTR